MHDIQYSWIFPSFYLFFPSPSDLHILHHPSIQPTWRGIGSETCGLSDSDDDAVCTSACVLIYTHTCTTYTIYLNWWAHMPSPLLYNISVCMWTGTEEEWERVMTMKGRNCNTSELSVSKGKKPGTIPWYQSPEMVFIPYIYSGWTLQPAPLFLITYN